MLFHAAQMACKAGQYLSGGLRNPIRRYALPALLLLIGLMALVTGPAQAEEPKPAGAGPVHVITLRDSINPGTTEFIKIGIDKANQADACLIVIQLDTPGGVVDSMRQMVQKIMQSRAPVAVYVAPAGARATSAGAFIVLSAGVAAMAPATHMGAASPVGAGGKEIEGTMAKKALSDLTALVRSLAKRRNIDPKLAEDMVSKATSYDASKAKELGLVDLIAPDLGTLLQKLEGRVVATGEGRRKISTKGKTLVFYEPGFRDKVLSALANPNLAYILLMLGMAGLYFELTNPGAIFPGVVGAVSLILAFFAMSALPVSYAGLALIGLAVVLFIAEIKITSFGMLSLAGALSLLLGSIMLFESEDELTTISLTVLVPTILCTIGFFAMVALLAGKAQLRKAFTGEEGLLGETAVVFGPGRVRVMGEIWRAKGAEGLEPGRAVTIVGSEGLLLTVEPRPEEIDPKGEEA